MRATRLLLGLALLIVPQHLMADEIVSTGYFDLTPSQFSGGLPTPNPWNGSPNTTFYGPLFSPGFSTSDPDEDGVMVQNTGASAVALQALKIGTVDLLQQDNGGNSIIINPGTSAIFGGVDGSDVFSSVQTIAFTLDSKNYAFSDATGSDFTRGALFGNTTTGSNDETVPWQRVADVGGAVVPEPSSVAMLLGAGLAGVFGIRRRRRAA